MSIRIGSKVVGDGNAIYVVAEMAWAHDGAMDKAVRIIDAAASAGADCINLHVTCVDAYITRDYGALPGQTGGGYAFLKEREFLSQQWRQIVEHARGRGLAVSTMCNDFPSLALATSSLAPDLLMIHPSCIGDLDFVRAVAGHGRPVLLYVGALSIAEIERAIDACTTAGNDRLLLQHGFQSYPTPVEENNLFRIRTLKALFGFPVAFGDHTDGGDPLALTVPLLSIGMGVNLIEKHITWDRAARGTDYQAALDPANFTEFVRQLRECEKALGSGAWQPLSVREQDYRKIVRKRAVLATPLDRGAVLTGDKLIYKRANAGLYPEDISMVLGRRARRAMESDQPIVREDFD